MAEYDDIQLPATVLDELYRSPESEPEDDPRADKLRHLGQVFAKKRDEAVAARKSSGIEDVWTAAEEAYLGIDDANRSQFAGGRWMKGLTTSAPLTKEGRSSNEDVRSTVFVPVTRRYVDAADAKVTEILFPPDDKAFSLKPTPIPELIKDKDSLERMLWEDGPYAGQPMERDMTPQEMQAQNLQPQPGETPPGVPIFRKDVVAEAMQVAAARAAKASDWIYDSMIECGYRREGRLMMFDSARLGVGVMKGPCPQIVKSSATKRIAGEKGPDGTPGKDRVVLQIVEEVKPASSWVDVWNFFPDPACGENIHHGGHVFERDFFSTKRLEDLKKLPNYHTDLIDQVIEEGPSKKYTTTGKPQDRDHKDEFEVWYGYLTVTREDLELVNPEATKGLPKDQRHVHAIMTLVNDTVIYGTLHPLDSGSFPYRVHCWTRRSGSWAGIGVGEQVSVPQRIVNGATRAMMNDAGVSCGAQLVMSHTVEPVDGSRKMAPFKVWVMNADATVGDDARKAFFSVEIPNHTPQLMSIVEYGFRLAEEASSIPLISQGQSGKTTPDTFGATQLQNNNANQLLRRVGYSFDDAVTEPTVKDYYEWMLMDPDVPEDLKGDFQINAHGSVALVERAIQDQTLWQMNEIVMADNVKIGVDPKKWFALLMKSRRLDPREVQFTPEEQAKLDSQPPPPPYQVQIAQLRAQAEARENGLDRQLALQIAQLERDRDTLYVQSETDRTTNEHQAKMKEIEAKINLAVLDYSNKRGISSEQVRERLASTSMRLIVQKQLAGLKGGVKSPQVATPAVEPQGRAENGKAFTQ